MITNKIQEKDFPKTWVSPNNRLISDKKNQLKESWHAEQKKRTPRPQTKQLNPELVNRKEQTEEKVKKSNQVKPLGTLQVKKRFCLIFRVVPSMPDLMEHLIKVHKVV